MKSLVGTRYFWGGNVPTGIPEMESLYPDTISQEDQDDLMCRGVDCSGLLHFATDGITPHTTGELISFGKEIAKNLNSASEVQKLVKPLDMMVWRGHVIFVLDSNQVIESRHGFGVIISSLPKRYAEVFQLTQNDKKDLYIRRWHPNFLT